MKTLLGVTAAAAALGLAGAAAPAAAESSVSFGLTVGNGGYYSAPRYGYYGSRYSRGWPSRYDRSFRRSCAYDPWCSPGYYGYRSRYYAPAPVYAPPPVVVYETHERYDPMPRWRSVAPQDGYYGPRGDYRDYDRNAGQDIYREPYRAQSYQTQTYQTQAYASGGAPTQGGAVRFDLAQQGYTAADLGGGYTAPSYDPYANSSYDPYASGYSTGGAVRYDQLGGQYGNDGAADSYIRGGGQDADDLLLGGPQ